MPKLESLSDESLQRRLDVCNLRIAALNRELATVTSERDALVIETGGRILRTLDRLREAEKRKK